MKLFKRFFKKRGIQLYQKPDKELNERDLDFIVCPNCGETETGNFCPNCGQSNRDFNKPLKDIVGDLAESINIDIRMKNTLIPFFTKPGFLTEEYFKGKRKRYVPPMRMYILMSIIFFFVIEKNSIKESSASDNTVIKADSIEISGITYTSEDTAIDLSSLDEEKIINELKKDSLDNTFVEGMVKGGFKAAKNKEDFKNKLRTNTSRLFFILMPIFALILMLIQRKSKMLYIKHLIFSINFHSFAFALLAIIFAIQTYFPGEISDRISILGWGVPLYLIFGMRYFYKRSFLRSLAKSISVLLIYSFVMGIVLLGGVIWTAYQF